MKTMLLFLCSILISVSLSSKLRNYYSFRYDEIYEQGKLDLIANSNYKTKEQAFDCVGHDKILTIMNILL